jgi:DNA-binding CsgD family transcriptional regulator
MKKKNTEKIIQLWRSVSDTSELSKEPDLKIVEQVASYFSPGSFFYFIFDFSQFKLKFVDKNIKNRLGIAPESFSPEAFLDAVHPEDLPLLKLKEQRAIEFLYDFIPPEDLLDYKVSYTMRMRGRDGNYYLNLHQSTAIDLTSNGKIGHVIGTETDVSHMTSNGHDTISFIGLNGKKSYTNLKIENFKIEENGVEDTILSPQELEILGKISFGESTESIAKTLNISPHTVRTHRQNILKKEVGKNMTEVISNHIRKGII